MSFTHIYVHRYTKAPGDVARCRSAVVLNESFGWVHQHQCSRKPKVFRCIDGVEYGFCGIHDPEAVAAKDAAKREQWRAESAYRQQQEKLRQQNAKAMAACKDAIQKIADGHNDPMTLAKETLLLFSKESV